PALAKRMQLLRTHGITRDAEDMTKEPDGPWYYEQVALGYNYRMTDVQAALGSSQMRRVDEFVAARRRLAARYDEFLSGLPLRTPWQHPDTASAWHLYVVRLKPEEVRRSHREVFEGMRAAGIGVNLHYIPVYRLPYHSRPDLRPQDFPQTERYYAEAISLPMYPALSTGEQDEVIVALRAALVS
ncbi:MAG: DegT/DnrJ/EryC1/StrS family aminotransferase, partial [Piscinibacter sp.]|uniref:DegT/DnrJ/EryC1/StrS family aminotransferase n=1 Tax=Piscinibacter sp. TaxID=1903157 RepID=UPI003D0C72E4